MVKTKISLKCIDFNILLNVIKKYCKKINIKLTGSKKCY